MSSNADEHSPSDIVVAQTVSPEASQPPSPAKQRSACLPCLAFAAVGLALLACIAGLGWFLIDKLKSEWARTPVSAIDEAPTTLWEQNREAFSQFPADAKKHPDFRALDRLVKRVSKVAEEKNSPQLLALIDVPRYTQEIFQYPEAQAAGWFARSGSQSRIRNRIIGPIPFSDYQIFKIEDLNPNERLIYLHTGNLYQGISPSRWWVIRKGNQWRLYDWDPIDFNLRDTHEAAIVLFEPDQQRTVGYQEYCRTINKLTHRPNLTIEIQAKDLRQCEQYQVSQRYLPVMLLGLANRWKNLGQHEAALRCLDRIGDFDLAPGAYSLRARIRKSNHEFAQALKDYQEYLDRVGPCPDTLIEMAECYQKLNDQPNRLKCLEPLVRFGSNTQTARYIAQALLYLPTEKFSSVLQPINQRDNTQQYLFAIADSLGFWSWTDTELTAFRDFCRNQDPDGFVAPYADALIAFRQGDPAQALDAIASALNHSSIDASSLFLLCETAAIYDIPIELYTIAKDKKSLFDTLSQVYEYQDFEFTAAQYVQLCQKHLDLFPGSPEISWKWANALVANQEFEEALRIIDQPAMQAFLAGERRDEAARLRAVCRYWVEGWKALAKESLSPEIALRLLSEAETREDDPAMRGLVQQLLPDTSSQLYYQGLIAERKDDLDQARASYLKSLQQHDEDHSHRWAAIQRALGTCTTADQLVELARATADTNLKRRAFEQLLEQHEWDALKQVAKFTPDHYPPSDTIQYNPPLDRVSMRIRIGSAQRQYDELIDWAREIDLALLQDGDLKTLALAALRTERWDAFDRFVPIIESKETRLRLNVLRAIKTDDGPTLQSCLDQLPVSYRNFLATHPDGERLWRRYQDPLRNQITLDWPAWNGDDASTIQVLLRDPKPLDRAEVVKWVEETVESLGLGPLSGPPRAISNGFLFQNGAYRIAVHLEPTPFQLDTYDKNNLRAQSLMEDHTHVLTLTAESIDLASIDDSLFLVLHLALGLDRDRLIAIGRDSSWLPAKALEGTDRTRPDGLSNVLRRFASLDAHTVWFIRPDDGMDNSFARTQFNAELFQAAQPWYAPRPIRTPANSPTRQLVLFADSDWNGLHLESELKLIRVTRGDYGQPVMHATLLAETPFFEAFRAGDSFRLTLSQIARWELRNESGDVLASGTRATGHTAPD